jgi:peptidyl-prolyl cis-trans isomerase B (cyclophilin B)
MCGVVVGVLVGASLTGCGHQPTSDPGQGASNAPASENSSTSGLAAVDPRWQQPFAEATVDSPSTEQWLPPETTCAGKSVGKLYTEVVRLWDTVRFQTPNGKWLAYEATLDTELGTIVIALRPELAPNHVRNFIGLALAGYYDGLVFERTVREESNTRADTKLELLEAGCPLGTGEAGYGSIGYWMKDESHPEVHHEEGTVGACHAEEPDTAACKFYITLSKAPFMDGTYTVFGKVVQGLDVARRIFSQPVRNDPEYPEGDRPEKPIVIHKVTIQAKEVDKLPSISENN